MGLKLVSENSDDRGVVSLLYKKLEPAATHVVIKPSHENFEWIDKIKEEIKKENHVWLLGDEQINGVAGLTNCLRKELGSKVHGFVGDEKLITNDVLQTHLAKYVVKEDRIGFNFGEHASETFVDTMDAYLDVKTRGDLSSFQWFEAPHKLWDSLSPKERDVNSRKINVFYAALNFKDVMVATGRIPVNAYPDKGTFGSLGMEFSGTDENGNRVCGICLKNSIATTLLVDERTKIVLPVPQHMSLEEAATIPVAYLTVLYSLIFRGKLLPKETVLIHAGSGGVGQAAIAVCLSMGCEVFTSVGTEEKKQLLKKIFPELEDRHFVNSRDLTFEEHILKETNGRGVDLVLNSLAEEKLRASINCVADFGRFIEIGKYDLVQNKLFDPTMMQRNISFHVVCVAHLIQQFIDEKCGQVQNFYTELSSMINHQFQAETLRPLNRVIFSSDEIEKAFRFMASGKHTGKVLIKLRDEEENMKYLKPLTVKAVSQSFLHPSKVYVLVGGLGGIGLELGKWLIDRGAKKLVFTSRTGIKDNYQKYRINKFEEEGVTVKVVCNDTSSRELTQKLITKAKRLGEIGGVFNLAMVLIDALFHDQTEETFRSACIPKANSTTYLDVITRKDCPKLEFFVCFSSLAAGVGNIAQSNYGFANSVMESICEKRRADGLHGVAIQWGAVGDVGFVLENLKTNDVVILGSVPQRIPSCMKAIDSFINSPLSLYSSYVMFGRESGGGVGSGVDLMRKITHILGISDPSSLDDNTTLGDLGLDSLMAVEIKSGLERDYNTVLSTQEIRLLTMKQIKELSEKEPTSVCSFASENESDYSSNFENPKELFVKLDNGNQGIPIFFVPPIEGDFKLMKPLVEHITRPVIGINWTDEVDPLMSIEEVAEFYVKNLREKYPQPEYEIVAYSFGSLIALEMCAQLQQIERNLAKKLVILDGDVDYMKYMTRELIQKANVSNEADAFQEMLTGFMALIYPIEIVEKCRFEISTLKSKDDQIKKAVDFINLLGYEKCTEELLKLAVQRSFDKLRRVHYYEPAKKFKGKVKLICSTREDDAPDIYSNDYVFKKCIDGKLDATIFTGDHRTFLAGNQKELGSLIDSELYSITS